MGVITLHDVACPHCLRETPTLTCSAEVRLTLKRLLALIFLCRNCNGITVAEVIPDDNLMRHYGSYIQWAHSTQRNHAIFPTSEEHPRVVNIYPKPNTPSSPEHVPANIQAVYSESEDNFNRGRFSTCVMLARKTLDLSTKVLGVSEGIDVNDLSKRIFKLRESGKITPEMAQWAKIVRLDGNTSTHTDDEFNESETRELLDFVETFLLYAFTLPAMVAANKHEQQ
ncbi:DUF4145 domain-containing protein [Serratia sp. CY76391]|uniref:DUF4145 domain-containing protein n=1 Tax=Serratia sp. CY76391 TaxID=3383681 RepID=UPI003FA07ECD